MVLPFERPLQELETKIEEVSGTTQHPGLTLEPGSTGVRLVRGHLLCMSSCGTD